MGFLYGARVRDAGWIKITKKSILIKSFAGKSEFCSPIEFAGTFYGESSPSDLEWPPSAYVSSCQQ